MINFSSIDTREKLLSEEARDIFYTVNYVFISSAISLFGVVANVINMMVFYKQGFASTMNISFFGLAISDLCGLLAVLWCDVCFNPLLVKYDVPIDGQEVLYLTGGMPHIYFGRTTAWITVYITAERCLSILVPLKVKLIITPKRTTIVVALIYTIMTFAFLPEYWTAYVTWKFYPERNKTMLGVAFTEDRENVEGLMYILYSILGLASFVAVIVFTVVLVVQLKLKSKWRIQASADKTKSESIIIRERRAVSMVAMIATVLIACYTPGAIITIAMYIVPGFNLFGFQANILLSLWSFIFILDALNSSINIFVYYTMSSKYRETFSHIFRVLVTKSRSVKHP